MNLVAALIALVIPPPAKPVLDILHLIEAIRQVEHSRIDYVSPSGARGVYQLKQRTWEEYSRQPFAWASDRTYVAQQETKRVALKHAHWVLEKAIPSLKIAPTPYSFALVWGPGYGNVDKLNLTDDNVDYAHRVENVYEQLIRSN